MPVLNYKDPKYIRKTGQWLLEIPAMSGDEYFYVGEYETEHGAQCDSVKYGCGTSMFVCFVNILMNRNIFSELFTMIHNCCVCLCSLYTGFKLGLNCNVPELIYA